MVGSASPGHTPHPSPHQATRHNCSSPLAAGSSSRSSNGSARCHHHFLRLGL
ncbi:hypothetical protein [Nonomuraea monospora]|uniref:hypothetical protein n=1 Tax=Nonomuraea monospora TaxID=568818 RepID=UPI0031E0CCAB